MVAVVPAAGLGTRLGADRPKALVPLAGVPIVVRAVGGLLASGVVDCVVVGAPREHVAVMADALGSADDPRVVVVPGADDRVGTVARALDAVPDDAAVVLVHDAARCLCPAPVVRAVVDAVRAGHEAVVPAVAVADTLKRVDDGGRVVTTVDRRDLVGVQTPQGFAPATLRAAHAAAAADRSAGRPVPATDDAGLVEARGGAVATVAGDPRALKITTALDLEMAEALVLASPA